MAKATKRAVEAWNYVLESDRDLDATEQSQFRLRPMTITEHAAFVDGCTVTRVLPDGTTETLNRASEQYVRLCLSHIESIENFPCGDCKPWPTKRDEREKYLEMLGVPACVEIGSELLAQSMLGADEKNG